MNYISTRSTDSASSLNFKETTLSGLANDGGLYVPQTWPMLSRDEIESYKLLNYADLASTILAKFSGNSISEAELNAITNSAYAEFDAPEVAPMVPLEDNLWVLELFHGPTLAFKDFALQVLGRLLEKFLTEDNQYCAIVGATSGDTGSAAIEAVRGQERITLIMLHPDGRVSDVQRKQMTTVDEKNIVNLAVDGSFDDCQNFVKDLFADEQARTELHLTAVNSINWARVAAQVVYYFYAALKVGGPAQSVIFSVPTGNFGNILAGYIAKQMGLPIERLIIASNSNDILTRFAESGIMETKDTIATASPSMDIQISSNFERLLFELVGRDSQKVRAYQDELKNTGRYQLTDSEMATFSSLFSAYRLDDDETEETIRSVFKKHNYILDPHSAIGVAAANALPTPDKTPVITLATAAPAKFGDIVLKATGQPAPIPEKLKETLQAKEHYERVPNDFNALRKHVFSAFTANTAAPTPKNHR